MHVINKRQIRHHKRQPLACSYETRALIPLQYVTPLLNHPQNYPLAVPLCFDILLCIRHQGAAYSLRLEGWIHSKQTQYCVIAWKLQIFMMLCPLCTNTPHNRTAVTATCLHIRLCDWHTCYKQFITFLCYELQQPLL